MVDYRTISQATTSKQLTAQAQQLVTHNEMPKKRNALIANRGIEMEGRETMTTPTSGELKSQAARTSVLIRTAGALWLGAAMTVMIGDTTYDMEMARSAGTLAVGVAWGYHEAVELRAAGADRIVEGFADLPGALAALLDGKAGDQE